MTTTAAHDDDMDRRVRANQKRLAADLERPYDFIVCGAGSSGSVVARRLAEGGTASVLVLEAGGSDDVPSITEAALWHTNISGERDWGFNPSRIRTSTAGRYRWPWGRCSAAARASTG